MKPFAVVSLLVCAALSCGPRQTTVPREPTPAPEPTVEPDVVRYRLSPVFDGESLVALAVELRFAADASGTTRLELPETWASENVLWKYVRDLEIVGADAVAEDGPATRVITAKGGAPITVNYRVVSAYDREPVATDGQPFAPIVRPQWFYVFGEALFAAPAGREDALAEFAWADAPAGFTFASDLEHLAAGGASVAKIRDSLAMGGRGLRIHEQRDGEAEIRVAMIGSYGFEDAAFVDMAMRVIAAERTFWGDHGEPYTITVAPLVAVQDARSHGGTGRSDGFTLMLSQDTPIEPLRHLLAHEYFHTWNADRLGGQQGGADEMAGKWFAEGFTEYYTWRLLLRSGLYTLEDFVADWNEALLEYAGSPVRNVSNARIMQDYWNVPEVGRLPYRRGPLLAVLWEQRLRAATKGARGLDDVMLAMRDKIRAAGTKSITPDAASLFLPTYVEAGGPDLAADHARYVDRGETIALPEDAFGDCVRVRDERRPTFDRGWDAEATTAAGNVVTGLRAGSSAHRAGLRNGMAIVRRLAGVPGDARVRYVLAVKDGKRERKISFFPRGEGEFVFQRLELVGIDSEAARVACTRALAGG